MIKQDNLSVAIGSIDRAIALMDGLMNDLSSKDTSEISNESLTQQLSKLGEIAKEVSNFYNQWSQSEIQGGLATLGKEVDMKLVSTDHLDTKQLKKTIARIFVADVAVRGLQYLRIHSDDFLAESQKIKAQECIEQGKLLKKLIDRTIDEIEADANALKQQRDNASLYYQIFMVSRAVKIAYGSLIVSSLAILLTALQALHLL